MPLVLFDGRGLRDTGVYCFYVDPFTGCATQLVYFDGTGLRDLLTATPEGSACPTIRDALDYDGRGLRAVSLSGVCGI
jgi:hypothetical protein